MEEHISRSRWDQIVKRCKQAKWVFDPSWKCLICGLHFRRCDVHTADDNVAVLAEAKTRFEKSLGEVANAIHL